jgi:hypothetical protein
MTCDDPVEPPSGDPTIECRGASAGDSLAAVLAAARSRWVEHGPTEYTFTQLALCECIYRPLLVHVVGERIDWVHEQDGSPVPPEEYAAWPLLTVPAIFDTIEEWIASQPYFVTACFDADLGYPRQFGFDWDVGVADDEVLYHVAVTQRQ